MSVEFKDYTIQVKKALNSGVGTGLRLAAVEIASKAARLSRVRSGQLKGSWTYLVDEGARTATIGSPIAECNLGGIRNRRICGWW